jgi:hypothetical protein
MTEVVVTYPDCRLRVTVTHGEQHSGPSPSVTRCFRVSAHCSAEQGCAPQLGPGAQEAGVTVFCNGRSVLSPASISASSSLS